jgi:hypothetical protein
MNVSPYHKTVPVRTDNFNGTTEEVQNMLDDPVKDHPAGEARAKQARIATGGNLRPNTDDLKPLHEPGSPMAGDGSHTSKQPVSHAK